MVMSASRAWRSAGGRVVPGGVAGDRADLDVVGVEREEADKGLEWVAIGEFRDVGSEVEPARAGEGDGAVLIVMSSMGVVGRSAATFAPPQRSVVVAGNSTGTAVLAEVGAE